MLDSLFKPNIAKMKSNRDIKGLITAIDYEKDRKIQEEAVLALCELRDEQALVPLITIVIKGEMSSAVLRKATDTLINFGVASAPLLIETLACFQGLTRFNRTLTIE